MSSFRVMLGPVPCNSLPRIRGPKGSVCQRSCAQPRSGRPSTAGRTLAGGGKLQCLGHVWPCQFELQVSAKSFLAMRPCGHVTRAGGGGGSPGPAKVRRDDFGRHRVRAPLLISHRRSGPGPYPPCSRPWTLPASPPCQSRLIRHTVNVPGLRVAGQGQLLSLLSTGPTEMETFACFCSRSYHPEYACQKGAIGGMEGTDCWLSVSEDPDSTFLDASALHFERHPPARVFPVPNNAWRDCVLCDHGRTRPCRMSYNRGMAERERFSPCGC